MDHRHRGPRCVLVATPRYSGAVVGAVLIIVIYGGTHGFIVQLASRERWKFGG